MNCRLPIVLISCLWTLLHGCGYQEKDLDRKNGKDILGELNRQFERLDKIKQFTEWEDSVISINEGIRKTIEGIRKPELLHEVCKEYIGSKKHNYSIVFSEDMKFAVFSWNTYLEIFPVKSITLFVSNGKVVPASMYGTPLIYEQIHKVDSNERETFYILKGRSVVSSDSINHICAFEIQADQLEEARVFMGNENTIANINNDGKENPLIEMKSGGKVLEFSNEMISTSGVIYHRLVFDGQQYIPQ